jgi:hypothetical protein
LARETSASDAVEVAGEASEDGGTSSGSSGWADDSEEGTVAEELERTAEVEKAREKMDGLFGNRTLGCDDKLRLKRLGWRLTAADVGWKRREEEDRAREGDSRERRP